MKICIITGPFMCLPPYSTGAIEKIWNETGEYWNRKGEEVLFISKRPSVQERNTKNRIYIKGYDRTRSWYTDFFLDLIYSFRALKAAPKSDIVILNSIWSPILYPLFKWKLKHALYNVARFPKKQLSLYKAVDCLSCVSISVYNSAIKQSPSIKDKLCVINNPIDTQIFSCIEKKKCSNCPTIVYSGRIHEEKGLHILVEAVEILNKEKIPVQLILIGPWDIGMGGSGEKYKNHLNAIAKSFEITWNGPIFSTKDLANKMKEGDIFCYPSVAEKGETFGVAPLEAMGLGIPTIVSNLECFKDFIENEKNGLVFDHKDKAAPKNLSQLILNLINSAVLYQKLSINGSKRAQDFSVEQIANQYYNKFLHIINGKSISEKY